MGYLKNKISAKSPETINQLEKAIEKEIKLIEIELLQGVFANLVERFQKVDVQSGWHIEK